MQKRRLEDRKLCIDVMDVHWHDADGKPQKAKAFLDNMSPSGAGLRLQVPVPVDVEIHWYRPRLQVSFWGRVRYCVPVKNGYSVGVRLEPACIESENRMMHHENLSPGQYVQARSQRCDPWVVWRVAEITDTIVTLHSGKSDFIGYRQPDGFLEDAGGRRIELRHAEGN